MDVRCERCGTEYDFDDALVSERGTTVKCTNCGHQFKVFPARPSGAGPERWVVQIQSGGVISFTSLRDLQKGIAAGRVGPADQLSRGGQPPRPLSSIAELEPFFRTAVPRSGVGGRTLAGMAPPLREDGSVPSQPYPGPHQVASGTSDSARERERGRTAPRLPMMEPARHQGSEPPTQRRMESLGGGEPPPYTSDYPRLQVPQGAGAEAPQQPAARVAAPGRLRADTAGMLADTLPGAGLRSPLDQAQRSVSEPDLGGTLRISVPNGEAPATPHPDGVAGEPSAAPAGDGALVPASPGELNEQPSEAAVRTLALQESPLADPAAPHAGESGTHSTADAPSPDTSQATAGQEPARVVPRVEPVEPAPTDAIEAVAARTEPSIQDEEEKFFTPPPRELSFSGSLSDPDPRYVPQAGPRGAQARWIVGVVMLGALALLAGTLGLSFVRRYSQPPAATSEATDPRVADFVARGRRLIDEGDLDGAAEELSKASVLAEAQPDVRLALAELELVRADRLWLQLRLLGREAPDRIAAVRGQLAAKLKRAQEATEAAASVKGDEVGTARVQVDLLRLRGELAAARRLVAPLSKDSGQAANAYVLAALDLAEPEPAAKSAVERLRKAAAAEGRLGRAHAALVYALALAGELDRAQAELAALAGEHEAHPLLPDLRAFLRRVDDEGQDAVVDADELAAVDPVEPSPTAELDEAVGDDFRARLAQANSALRHGHLEQADRLFRRVAGEQPGNTEALAGMAEVARQRNDPGAAAMYDRVLEKNPSYLPALMARADQKWDAGDRSGAAALYRRVLAQAGPTTTYGRRAQTRLAQTSNGGDQPQTSPPAPPVSPGPVPESTSAPAPEPAPPPEAPPDEPSDSPHIDTTDLPDFQ